MRLRNLIQGSPEWHKWRSSGIGSSDIAKITGVSPFGSAFDFYNEKSGIVVTDKSSYATERGKHYEPIVREKFNKLQNANYETACFQHDNYCFILASLDGYDEATNTLIEIKVPGKKDLELAAQGEIPEYYKVQIQWQLGTCGAQRAYYICYDPKTDQMYIVTVARDEETIQRLFHSAHIFWDNFLRGIPPVKRDDVDVDFITDEKFVSIALQAQKIKGELLKWELQWDEVKKEILNFGKGRSFRGYGISAVKTSGRKTYDTDAMVADGIDIERYAKVGKESYTIKIDK